MDRMSLPQRDYAATSRCTSMPAHIIGKLPSPRTSISHSNHRLSSLDSVKLNNKDVYLVNPCKPKYICQICNELLKDPIQTMRGELACRVCYKSKQRKKGICPIDGEPIGDKELFPDKSMSREINKLECVCVNGKYGCLWIGALGDVNSHESGCQYREIKCSSCGSDVVSKLLDEHKERECFYRYELCRYCEKRIQYAEMEIHEATCVNKPSPCPFKCPEILKKGEAHLHVETCRNIRDGVICPYNAFGCTFKPTNQDTLLRHLITDSIPHIGLVITSVNLMKNEAYGLTYELNQEKKHRTYLENELQQLKDKMSIMSQEHERQMNNMEEINNVKGVQLKTEEQGSSYSEAYNRCKGLESYMSNFQFENDKSFQKLLSMQTQIDNIIPGKDFTAYSQNNKDLDQLKEQLDRFETKQAQCISQISDAEMTLQLLENTTYDGRLIWKIDNFAYRTRQAEIGKVTVLHSAPCFTKKFEYKFCSRVYLNGDGVGKCSHLSLFVCFMKSTLDDQLKWPVEKKVTFRLLHPTSKEKSPCERFITDTNSSSFKKPVKEMNIAAGCPLFIKKEDVFCEGFVVNDSIYIETLVE